MAIYLTDVFTGTNNTAWNGNWVTDVNTTGASAYIYNNRGRGNAGSNTNYAGSVAVRASGAGQHADIEVDFTFRFVSGSDDGAMELWVRTPSVFSGSDGYYLFIDQYSYSAQRMNNWSWAMIGSSTDLTFSKDTDYKGKFKVTGTGATVTITHKVWLASDSEPSWITNTDTSGSRITTSNYAVFSFKTGNTGGQIIDIDDVTISDGTGSYSGSVTHQTTQSRSVVGQVNLGSKQGAVSHQTTQSRSVIGKVSPSVVAIIASNINCVGKAAVPPPTISIASLATPSPGVRITVTFVTQDADTVTIYRTSASLGRVSLRGATNAILTGTFYVDDYEAPLNEQLTYTAVTKDILQVPSTESDPQITQIDSVFTWLTDPVIPTNATSVRVSEFPSRSMGIEHAMLSVIGSNAPVMIAGQRQLGSGKLAFYTASLDELKTLRSVLASTPVVLLRAPYTTWDLGSAFLGIGSVVEQRVTRLITEPSRIVECDVTFVTQPPPIIMSSVHTYSELQSKGYTYRSISLPDISYLQLSQRGGL